MAWIIGVYGDIHKEVTNEIAAASEENTGSFSSSKVFIRYGVNKDTFHINATDTKKEGWFASGVGIKMNDHFSFLGYSDWDRIKKNPSKSVSKLDGHFVFCKWDDQRIEFFTDPLGFRSLYLVDCKKCILFSTRLDLISRFSKFNSLDIKAFSSQWLLLNKLSLNSNIERIHRISQGGYSKFEAEKLIVTNNPWLPGEDNTPDGESFESLLNKITVFPIKEGHTLSLGLSGGIDSRALLSVLLSSQKKGSFEIHSLHNPGDPDKELAKKISAHYNLTCNFYEDEIPDTNSTVTILSRILGQTGPISPVSSALGRDFYRKLKGKVIIDGGLGEIVRRRYLNTLYYKGKKALVTGNAHQIRQYLSQNRSPIFNTETLAIMEEGITEQIHDSILQLPKVNDAGIRNWLDLLAIRTRFPNLAGLEQSRVDNEVISYMPYAQSTLLKKYFINNQFESGDNNWTSILLDNNPKLKSFPLVKEGITYPFTTNIFISSLRLSLKRKLGRFYQSDYQVNVLDSLYEFANDLVHSESTRNDPLYNYTYIKKIVDDYYAGMKQLAPRVDWWLSFEIWKNTLKS